MQSPQGRNFFCNQALALPIALPLCCCATVLDAALIHSLRRVAQDCLSLWTLYSAQCTGLTISDSLKMLYKS